MFGWKIREKKAQARHSMAFYIIGIFTFAIESMLGVNASFLVHQSVIVVAHNMLAGLSLEALASIIALLISLAVGFCFVFGGMWTFGGFMTSLEDASAYQEEYAAGWWPVALVWFMVLAVVGLDFTTLMFRAEFFAEKGAGALFFFFLILIFLPFVLGVLVHVLEHTPRNRRLARARVKAEAIEVSDIEEGLEVMDSDLRSRWLDGDADALQEHYDRVEGARQEEAAQARQREQDRLAKLAARNRPLPVASHSNQAQLGSAGKNGSK